MTFSIRKQVFVKSSSSIVGVLLIIVASIFTVACKKSPDAFLQDFYAWEGTEQTVADPLIVAGDEIVPLLLSEVKRDDMPKRMAAIYFLCDFGYRDAIPVVEAIVQDETEDPATRAG